MNRNFIIGYNTAVKRVREGKYSESLTRGNNKVPKKFLHRNGEHEKPTVNGLYWIKGDAIIRQKMWPFDRGQRVTFHGDKNVETETRIPVEINGGLIDLGMDVYIPVEWVTAKSEFYGPVIFTMPWEEK